MPTPREFMMQYRNLQVDVVIDDPIAKVCRPGTYTVQLKKYFMMDWAEGAEERRDYDAVTRGSKNDTWFQANKDRIRTAAMGKGAPQDYELALEWAVMSNKVPNANQASVQTYCDDHLGIDCSGFVTNYLVAAGKKTYSSNTVRNTSAASYFHAGTAVNDASQVRQGDLLVWMSGNSVLTSPGHVAVVESYIPASSPGGNMRVVEATGAAGANPKLLDSMYTVEQIIPIGGAVPVMILVVKRHGVSGSRVSVRRV
ncbi:MAG: C40 family peptidase [Bryobacterales bacterium]|nr:C40 family peptidase [Bryobacterales bacterium]